jgi:hypothetical protein
MGKKRKTVARQGVFGVKEKTARFREEKRAVRN